MKNKLPTRAAVWAAACALAVMATDMAIAGPQACDARVTNSRELLACVTLAGGRAHRPHCRRSPTRMAGPASPARRASTPRRTTCKPR